MSKTNIDNSGSDVEVVCGEWEIGNTSASLSGEKYNIILPIVNIVRHPGRNNSRVYFKYEVRFQFKKKIWMLNNSLDFRC